MKTLRQKGYMSYPTLHSQHLVELESNMSATIIIVHTVSKRNTIHKLGMRDQRAKLTF